MQNLIERIKDRLSELKNNPDNRKYFIAIVSGLGVVALVAIVLIANGLKTISIREGGASASELIEGNSSNVERNAAGGIIADINWDNIIGYDKDGNPIYGTNGMVPSVGGYDMCGAPIASDKLVVIGYAEDGLPIYDYSAIDQARIRGLSSGTNPDIDWNSIVGYDSDGNPIFGSFGADPNILGYDMLGNPIYKGSVTVTGRTDSGMPIYGYSTRDAAKSAGIAAQNALKNGRDGANGIGKDGLNGADGAAADGSKGTDGKNGTNGQVVTKYVTNDPSATNSADGDASQAGQNGLNGNDGLANNGTNGTNGTNGEAADAGVVAALQKTVDELKSQFTNGSLKGEQGEQGEKGEQGAQGQQGQQGQQGAQGATGATGATGAQGATGAMGAAGKDGQDGKDGVSSYTYIRYATQDPSTYPSTQLYSTPTAETKYMGIATSTSTSAPSRANAYSWSQYKDLSISATTDADGVTTLVIH